MKPARQAFRAHPSFTGRVNLAEVNAADTQGVKKKPALSAIEGDWSTELGTLQEKLWAQQKKSMDSTPAARTAPSNM